MSSLQIENRSSPQGHASVIDYAILIPVRSQNFSVNCVDLLPKREEFLTDLYYSDLLMKDDIVTGGFNDSF